MAKQQSKRAPAGSAFCSVWQDLSRNEQSAELYRAPTGQPNETAEQKKCSFKKARYWFRENGFVRLILLLRHSFYNYGFHLVYRDGSPVDEAWFEDNEENILSYAHDGWREWLQLDNTIGLWRKSGNGRLLTKAPEDVDYKDDFGEEVLKFQHGMKREDILKSNLSQAEKARLLKSSEIELRHDDELFDFRVLKRERVGYGLASTGLRPVFLAASGQESLEVSDGLLGFACRNIYEQHQLGHEIKSGTFAGSPRHFIKKATAEAIKKELKGRFGKMLMVTNFDHKVIMGAGLPDPKQFAGSRYDGIFERMFMWAMPLGHILTMKSINPYLPGILQVQAAGERELMGRHLASVINTLKPPKPIKAVWSDRCFQDNRIFADLLKIALQSGPLSQESFLEQLQFNATKERARKKKEGELPDEQVEPRFDSAHGKPQAKAGRPPGRAD